MASRSMLCRVQVSRDAIAAAAAAAALSTRRRFDAWSLLPCPSTGLKYKSWHA